MQPQQSPPFAGQRIIFLALLLGMTMFAVVAGVVVQMNDGKGLVEEPIELLDLAAMIVGGVTVVGAFVIRGVLTGEANKKQGAERKQMLFTSRLIPIAMLEGGSLLGTVTWLLNGNAVPGLVVAMVTLAIAIAITPFSDPDAGVR